MPSRKNGSSDAQSESRRSSLRRLSSIASFQNLFARRKSNNTDTTIASSSSNLSLTSSTIANAPEPNIPPTASNESSQHEDTLAELPPPPVQNQLHSRRSSYICLPDDPIGGMPRSRTFSNLPLPTRAKKSNPLLPSKSHSRLPSAFLPSTRLPSSSMSNRKHSHSRLPSAGMNSAMIRNRLQRSDTEPLLAVHGEQQSNNPRSTAFKENISLSPIKPLPEMDMFEDKDGYGSFSPSNSCISRRPWQSPDGRHQPLLLANFASSLPFSQHPAVRMVKEHKSSPVYRSSRDRPPTPGGSRGMDFQRWSSQPLLTNATNVTRHSSQQAREIKQTRLMSARQAPTPPLSKTPTTSQKLASGKAKSFDISAHTRGPSERTPSRPRTAGKQKCASPKKKSVLEVSTAEPPQYWLGRLSALSDRYRTAELASLSSTSSNPKSKSETDKMHTPDANISRLRKAFEALHELCVTQEAADSLVVFQLQFAGTMGLAAELGRPIVLNALPKLGEGGDEVGEEVGMSEGRKISFMDRLLGRQKRGSLVIG